MYREINYAFASYDIELIEASLRHYLRSLMEADALSLPDSDFGFRKPFVNLIADVERLLSKLQTEMARQKASKEQLIPAAAAFEPPK